LCSPSAAPALGLYNEKFTLFDCFDAWGEFPGEEKYREGIEDALNRAGTKVDIILTTAPELQQKLSHLNQNTFLIRNGCDPDHYNNPGIIPSGGDRLYDPDDLPRPVIGYMGDIAPWLELDHIYNAAERHPDWSFVMLGTWKRDDKLPSSLPNILAPGRVNYDELPFYVRGFDVGTIPFALNELTRVVNPLKLYEYFSLGMPVVSTPIPEVARNEDLVYLAGTPDEFVMLLEVAVKEPADKEVRGKRIAVARENSWNSRAREIIKLISERKG
jgi:glycosyltransferase involved in cell wall biosynthesis